MGGAKAVTLDCFRWLWLEFVDVHSTAVAKDYVSPYDVTLYQVVLNDQYMIPSSSSDAAADGSSSPNVAVVELSDVTPKNLIHHKKRPDHVTAFLTQRGLTSLYESFTHALYETKGTRNWADSWRTTKLLEILQQEQDGNDSFQDQFAAFHIQVVICKMIQSEWSTLKWIELIDRSQLSESTYWPQYNVDTDSSPPPEFSSSRGGTS
mmetsp:Transcript_37475/g.77729  ORF Transcript_37475/g.77729 Transcript_37475/m.77729 type:complete len:207 (-) Transcript_37475:1467-2087(-)